MVPNREERREYNDNKNSYNYSTLQYTVNDNLSVKLITHSSFNV